MEINETNQFFKAFADETRMRILHILTAGELCVCDIMSILDIPQSKISRHLAYLRKCGLVKDKKDGLWVYYSLGKAQSRLQKNILNCVKRCFCDVSIMKEDLKKAKAAIKNQACCS